MAIATLSGCLITIAGTDISDHVKEVDVDDGREEFDDTVMSHTAKSTTGGLPNPSITLKNIQDYGAGKTHELFKAAVNVSTAVVVRVTSSARSGTNPEFQLIGKILQYKPIAGQAGKFQEPSVKFVSTGTPMSTVTTAT